MSKRKVEYSPSALKHLSQVVILNWFKKSMDKDIIHPSWAKVYGNFFDDDIVEAVVEFQFADKSINYTSLIELKLKQLYYLLVGEYYPLYDKVYSNKDLMKIKVIHVFSNQTTNFYNQKAKRLYCNERL